MLLDSCTPSNSGGLITLYTWSIAQTVSNYVLGGITPNGPGCIAFASWSYWAPYYQNLLMIGL